MAAFNSQNDNCMDFEVLLPLENIPSFSSNRCQPRRVRKIYNNQLIVFKYMLFKLRGLKLIRCNLSYIHVSNGVQLHGSLV